MTLTVNLRKMVHRKSAEYLTPLAAGNTATGGYLTYDKSDAMPTHDTLYYVGGTSVIWNYNADQDGWVQIPNSGIAGTFGAGACGEFRSLWAPAGAQTVTATAGSTTTLTTALTLVRSLASCEVRVVAGTGIGYTGTVSKNTLGTNCVITVTPTSGTAFDATTQFQVFSGSVWFLDAGAGAIGFSVYDRATNAWTARSVTNLPTTWATDGQLVSTLSRVSNRNQGFVTGTSTGTNSTTTLNDTGKTWPTNGFTNYQVRITAGTGIGQIRTISSNTGTALTVSVAWTVIPDATSVYRVEGNDDYMYLIGNNAVTLYRYVISTNTWSTLTPTAARSAAPGPGNTMHWVDAVQDSTWSDGTYSTFNSAGTIRQNGRYLYSFRANGTGSLDIYDIALNTWYSSTAYGNIQETFTTGSCGADMDGYIYLQKDATSRIYRFDVANNVLEPFAFNFVPQSSQITGQKMALTLFKEGASRLTYLYTLPHSRADFTRWLVV